ncbi:OmpA family protein [Flavimobilis sp. GY10621]|uniref:OmpA family protein n=1 Tax=Flavimobilis rhizosphaerae TaxID=2775421 RepID=A0ABR9DNU7_9MICO|nr:OmpA family protein [Flavimobilis rhizosphaerae]MBD9698791.1 OmpA family protein [Flavimobilis rhizosphaerae]
MRPVGSVPITVTTAPDMTATIGGEVTAWVHPVQSSAAEGRSLATVEIVGGSDADPESSSFIPLFEDGPVSFEPRGLKLLDLDAGLASSPLRAGDEVAAVVDDVRLAPGGTRILTAAFPAVSSPTLSVHVPGFDIVQVPVVEQGSDHWLETAKPWAGSAALAGAFTSLEARAMSLVTKSTVEVAGDQVLVELPADVLFAFNKSNLSGKTQKVVDTAGRKIAEAAAASGEITVVGHTDDQGDAASNTTLSKARAESVAEGLRPILGAVFTVKTEGRGSSEPMVEGASEEARAANRRVEITLTGRSAN